MNEFSSRHKLEMNGAVKKCSFLHFNCRNPEIHKIDMRGYLANPEGLFLKKNCSFFILSFLNRTPSLQFLHLNQFICHFALKIFITNGYMELFALFDFHLRRKWLKFNKNEAIEGCNQDIIAPQREYFFYSYFCFSYIEDNVHSQCVGGGDGFLLS